jgi:Flp pilus assembly protein CpaB
MTALIPEGMRAVTLETRAVDGIGGRIMRGDHVDVVLTCPFSYFETSTNDESIGVKGVVSATRMGSRILVQNAEVLCVDRGDGDWSPSGVSSARRTLDTVTLLVSPRDAERLTVAQDATKKSTVRLISRNPEDGMCADTEGQLLMELLTQKRQYSSVDVIRGNIVSQNKFYTSIERSEDE